VAAWLAVAMAAAHELRAPPLLALPLVAAARLGAALLRHRRRRRAVEAVARVCPEVALGLAAELRAGRTPGDAVAAVAGYGGPLQRPLRRAAAAVRAGASPAAELTVVARTPGAGSLRSVAAAWQVTEEAGGPVADILERLADTLDAERAGRDALDAALAAPRATMLLLCLLPLGGVALGQTVGAHPARLLLHRPLGALLLGAAASLDLVGTLWTRRLVRRALRG
jgi:tight adherence protein B